MGHILVAGDTPCLPVLGSFFPHLPIKTAVTEHAGDPEIASLAFHEAPRIHSGVKRQENNKGHEQAWSRVEVLTQRNEPAVQLLYGLPHIAVDVIHDVLSENLATELGLDRSKAYTQIGISHIPLVRGRQRIPRRLAQPPALFDSVNRTGHFIR